MDTPIMRAKQLMAHYLVMCHEYTPNEAKDCIDAATAAERVELMAEIYASIAHVKFTSPSWTWTPHEVLLLIQDMFDLESIQKWWEKNGLRYR